MCVKGRRNAHPSPLHVRQLSEVREMLQFGELVVMQVNNPHIRSDGISCNWQVRITARLVLGIVCLGQPTTVPNGFQLFLSQMQVGYPQQKLVYRFLRFSLQFTAPHKELWAPWRRFIASRHYPLRLAQLVVQICAYRAERRYFAPDIAGLCGFQWRRPQTPSCPRRRPLPRVAATTSASRFSRWHHLAPGTPSVVP